MWVALLAFLGVAILLIQLRRHQFRSTTARDLTREQLARLRDQKGVQEAMDQLLLQLEELSRRINAQADTKFLKLETVVRDADDRIARLERLLGRGEPAPSRPAESRDAQGARPTSDARPTRSPPTRVEQVKGEKPATPSSPLDLGTTDTPPDPRIERVHRLADAGRQPIKIAEELSMPLGEVEFILNLRDFR
jgi:hypothetical protein